MEFFIFHFKLHLISWPSLELCDSFLPFPPRPLFLVKESRAWLPLELIRAAQLPPPCGLVEEAGLRLEQPSIRNGQGAFVEAAVSLSGLSLSVSLSVTARLLRGTGNPEPGQHPKVLLPPVQRQRGQLEWCHSHSSKWLRSLSKDAARAWSFLEMSSERSVWSGSWLMNCPGSDTSSPLEITLKMARKRGGAGFRGRVSAGADSSLERHLSGHIPVLPSPLAGRSITAAAWAPHDPKCRDLGGVLWLQDFIVTTAQREWQQRLGWDMWNTGALALSSFTPSVHCSHGCICRGDSGWGEDGSDTWIWLLCKSTKHEV